MTCINILDFILTNIIFYRFWDKIAQQSFDRIAKMKIKETNMQAGCKQVDRQTNKDTNRHTERGERERERESYGESYVI